MAKIVLSTMGSLGDLHPMIALAVELRKRGHEVVVNSWDGYTEKVGQLGFEFFPLRPTIDPTDRELFREAMDTRRGPEKILRELVFPNLREMYDDVFNASAGADLLISGELVYVAKSVVEKTGIKWITTTLSPLMLFSFHDPGIYPTADWLEVLRPLPTWFHRGLFSLLRLTINHWLKPYRSFRRELGLDPGHDPMFFEKFSDSLHLAMFSKAFAKPQPDWPTCTLQTGFCFYDGHGEAGTMPEGLAEFLASGEPPIVFTLGSAAVMDPRDFFEVSARAAKQLNRRAVLIYGIFNHPPDGLDENIVGFDYAPYSLVFSRAACVVHQGGVGTTGQVLRAGVPHLIMPYGHDQPDNAARCRRLGVAEVIDRDDYNVKNAVTKLRKILSDRGYTAKAFQASRIVEAERGTTMACDAIEDILKK